MLAGRISPHVDNAVTRADDLLRAGRTEEAAFELEWQARSMSKLMPASDAASLEDKAALIRWYEDLEPLLATIDVTQLTQPRQALRSEGLVRQADLFEILERSDRASVARVIGVVQADVKDFAGGFAVGARDPARYLQQAKRLHPSMAAYVDAWQLTPPKRRVFFIGARSDSSLIQEAERRFIERGYRAFFYDFCERITGALCPDEIVGAFAADSGMVIVTNTDESRASRFVAVEIRAAMRARNGQAPAIMITPEEIRRAGAGTVTGSLFLLTAGSASGRASELKADVRAIGEGLQRSRGRISTHGVTD